MTPPLDADGERLTSLQDGLVDLCDGLIYIRKQNGAITGIVTPAVLLNGMTHIARWKEYLNKEYSITNP